MVRRNNLLGLQTAGPDEGGDRLQVNLSTSSVTFDSSTSVGASIADSSSCVGISVKDFPKSSAGIMVSRPF